MISPMSLYGYIKKTKPANWTTTPNGKRLIALRQSARISHRKAHLRRFNASSALRQRKPVRRVSKAYSVSMGEYRKKAHEFVKAAVARGETCPVVAAIKELHEGFRYGWPISNKLVCVHHVRGRGHGGRGPLLLDERYWLACSLQGHRWIDANKDEARKRGWLAQKGDWNKHD